MEEDRIRTWLSQNTLDQIKHIQIYLTIINGLVFDDKELFFSNREKPSTTMIIPLLTQFVTQLTNSQKILSDQDVNLQLWQDILLEEYERQSNLIINQVDQVQLQSYGLKGDRCVQNEFQLSQQSTQQFKLVIQQQKAGAVLHNEEVFQKQEILQEDQQPESSNQSIDWDQMKCIFCQNNYQSFQSVWKHVVRQHQHQMNKKALEVLNNQQQLNQDRKTNNQNLSTVQNNKQEPQSFQNQIKEDKSLKRCLKCCKTYQLQYNEIHACSIEPTMKQKCIFVLKEIYKEQHAHDKKYIGKVHKCSTCNKVYPYKKNLDNHKKKKHSKLS